MDSQKDKYVAEFMAQLRRFRFCKVYVAEQDLWIDFRIVRIKSLHKHSIPIVLSTGLGSGLEGIVSLAFELACEGYEIILLSFPGYGSSNNPNFGFCWNNLFLNFAHVILALLRKLGIHRVFLLGHSMGAEIMAKAAVLYPPICKGLILLSPSGLYNLPWWRKLILIWKFPASGLAMRKEYERHVTAYLQPLIELCDEQESPWKPKRLLQRLAEFCALGKGSLIETLPLVQCPVSLIVGSRDTVFPADKCRESMESILGRGNFREEIIRGGFHNMTLSHGVEECANGIARCIVGLN